MGHTLRKVEPGDLLVIPAATYNKFVDVPLFFPSGPTVLL